MEKTLEYYMALPYTIELTSDPEGGWFAAIKELPGCMSQGDTPEEALEMIRDAQAGWLSVALEDGPPFPSRGRWMSTAADSSCACPVPCTATWSSTPKRKASASTSTSTSPWRAFLAGRRANGRKVRPACQLTFIDKGVKR